MNGAIARAAQNDPGGTPEINEAAPAIREEPLSILSPGIPATADDYWPLTSQPLHSLLFLLPLIFLLEIVRRYSPPPASLGVEGWISQVLQTQGLQLPGLMPGTLCLILIGWHLVGRYPTRFRPLYLTGMAAESLMYACLLIVIGQLQDLFFQHVVYRPLLSVDTVSSLSLPERFVLFVSAGLYEEVIFRLSLLPLLWGLLRLLSLPSRLAASFAIFFTSAAFAAAHHLSPNPDPYSALTLSFRIVAGIFLSLLFFRRGFGITAGCHTAYDVLVGVIMQSRN